jgi:hypothetical protein
MLDARGLYGKYETTGQKPTNLDACGGHYGPVPGITVGSDTYGASTNVYHYHTQDQAPFTVGCFGPVTSLTQCKSLYSTCNTGYASVVSIDGSNTNYDLDCPCFKMGTESYNQLSPTSGSSPSLPVEGAMVTMVSLLAIMWMV